jgi:hypothetical protein
MVQETRINLKAGASRFRRTLSRGRPSCLTVTVSRESVYALPVGDIIEALRHAALPHGTSGMPQHLRSPAAGQPLGPLKGVLLRHSADGEVCGGQWRDPARSVGALAQLAPLIEVQHQVAQPVQIPR